MSVSPPSSRPGVAEQIAATFCDALELPPAEREAFLREACVSPVLHHEVRSLLRAHASSDRFLDRSELTGFAAGLAAGDGSLEGSVVGRYRLLRELGRGGMGTVYLAERADGEYEQRVAVKLVRAGVADRLVLSRFLRERRILARLEHPHIARLVDGGADQGRPYLVMEYVDGIPITAFYQRHGLTVRARVERFLDVCDAVHCAHRNLVVHRDLKPGNILITTEGQVKLLDFGIAKLLDPEGGDGLVTLAEFGPRVMTPDYAAPEQIRGEPVTTATDIYALGVVLYELLSGRRPYQFESRTPESMARTIARHDVVPPSLAGGQRLRSITADLDAITLKALRRDPDLRYPSAEALVQDLKRYLAGLPVVARRGTLAYRIGRFVRRNRAAVLAGGLAIASLLGGIAGTAWQARRAARERDAAVKEADKAARVSAFMSELFQMAKPGAARGREVTVREMLDSGRAFIERDLGAHPELRLEIQSRLAEVYYTLGQYREAQHLWEAAIRLSLAAHGPIHPSVLRDMLSLTKVLSDLGLSDSAAALAHRAHAVWRRLPQLPERDFQANHILARLADALRRQGRLAASDSVARQALAMLPREHPEASHRRSVILTTLAHVRRDRGQMRQAEPIYREVLDLRRRYWGREHPEVTNAMVNLGGALAELGRFDEAERLLREGLAQRLRLQGEAHPDYGLDLRYLARLHHLRGDMDSAQWTYRRALELQRAAFPPDHPQLIPTLLGMGECLRGQSRPEEAEELLREAARIRRHSGG